MDLIWYIILFSLIGGVFSLIGGVILLLKKQFAQEAFVHLISFAAGALLGAVFLDVLPEAMEAQLNSNLIFLWALAGFVALFLLEGLFLRFNHHFHGHDEIELDTSHHTHIASRTTPWLLLLADSVHNFVDGIAIAAAFFINIPTGIVTALATAAHEIPQEIGDFSIMLRAGWKKARVLWWNIAAALMTTLGALIALAFKESIEPIAGMLLALAAGMFIYIGASDLIPEMYHSSRKDKLSHVMTVFVLGIVLVGVLVQLLEG